MYGKINGVEVDPSLNIRLIRDQLYDIELPRHSDEGILTIARKIKYEADLGRGTSGVVQYLKTVYPTMEHEEARKKARAM